MILTYCCWIDKTVHLKLSKFSEERQNVVKIALSLYFRIMAAVATFCQSIGLSKQKMM